MSKNNKISLKKLSMRSKISSELITPNIQRLQNRISSMQKSESKNKLRFIQNNSNLNKFRNLSSTNMIQNNNKLPNININYSNNTKFLEDNSNLKNSFTSTFYSSESNKQNLILDNIDLKSNSNEKRTKVTGLTQKKKLMILKTKSYSRYDKKLQINPIFFENKNNIKKNNEKINIFLKNKENSNIKTEGDYSLIMKKLDRWDKDNCFVKQYDKLSLYRILNSYYKKKGLIEDLKNLNTMDSLLKSKSNYDKLVQNRLNYKSNRVITDILDTPRRKANDSRKSSSHFKRNSNINNSDEASYNKKDVNVEENKFLSEKLKYETQLHNDILYVNNIIYNKKCLKKEKSKILEEMYLTKNNLIQEYEKKYNNYMKEYWSRYDMYDQSYRKLKGLYLGQNKKPKKDKKENESKEDNKDKDNKDNKDNKEKKDNENEEIKVENNDDNNNNNNEENNNEKKNNENEEKKKEEIKPKEEAKEEEHNFKNYRKNLKKKTLKIDKLIHEMDFMKNTQLNSINLEVKKHIEELQTDYKNRYKVVKDQIKVIEEEINIIINELNYYKQVNEELIREHRTYYMNILKKGKDYRKEGLVWVVKNLLELQIHLEYQHFPKYLTHEQIDYLINLANLLLEQSELIIIIKVLKKKQKTSNMDENIKVFSMLDKYMEKHTQQSNNENNFMIGDIQEKINGNYSRTMLNIIQDIDKKFYKVYKNNKEVMKEFLEKNEEEIKLRNALMHIKKGLYNSDKFIEENQNSILDAFMCSTKNKDFFSFILKINNRLSQLEKIIYNIIKNEKENFNEQIKKINNSGNKNFDTNFYKDVVKKSLFGEKCDF